MRVVKVQGRRHLTTAGGDNGDYAAAARVSEQLFSTKVRDVLHLNSSLIGVGGCRDHKTLSLSVPNGGAGCFAAGPGRFYSEP
jgi:hypothetical protein